MREAQHYLLQNKSSIVASADRTPIEPTQAEYIFRSDLYWFTRSGNDTKGKAGAGAQAVEEITVFFWPSHTLVPFLVAGLQLVTSSKGGFLSASDQQQPEDSQRLFCLGLASNSLNPHITFEPQVFVYHGLYMHVFIMAACHHRGGSAQHAANHCQEKKKKEVHSFASSLVFTHTV